MSFYISKHTPSKVQITEIWKLSAFYEKGRECPCRLLITGKIFGTRWRSWILNSSNECLKKKKKKKRYKFKMTILELM